MQAVAFEKDGGAVRMFVEANPQYKSINLYDSELKRVPKESLSQYQMQSQGEGKNQQQKEKESKGHEQKNGDGQQPKKTKGKSISKSA